MMINYWRRNRNELDMNQLPQTVTRVQQAFLDASVPLPPTSQTSTGVNYGEYFRGLDQDWLQRTVEIGLITVDTGLTGEALTSAASGIVFSLNALGVLVLL